MMKLITYLQEIFEQRHVVHTQGKNISRLGVRFEPQETPRCQRHHVRAIHIPLSPQRILQARAQQERVPLDALHQAGVVEVLTAHIEPGLVVVRDQQKAATEFLRRIITVNRTY